MGDILYRLGHPSQFQPRYSISDLFRKVSNFCAYNYFYRPHRKNRGYIGGKPSISLRDRFPKLVVATFKVLVCASNC